MASIGYKALVKASGTAISLSNAGTTKLSGAGITANTQYQITNPVNQVLDPEFPVTVQVDADGGGAGTYATVSATTYTVNRLTGTIIFNTAQPAAATVQVSGRYLPISTVAEASEFTYTIEADNQANPVFTTPWQRRKQGLKDFSAELSQWYSPSNKLFYDCIQDGRTLMLEFWVNNTLDLRGWVKTSSDEVSGSADGMMEEAIEFEGTTDNEGRMIS